MLSVIFSSSSFETYVRRELTGGTRIVRLWTHCVCICWNTRLSQHCKTWENVVESNTGVEYLQSSYETTQRELNRFMKKS